MTDFSPWLRPTLLGPFITTCGFTTLALMTFGLVLPNGEHLDAWLLAMISATFFASTVAVALITSDVLLLRLKLRRLPTGFGAWVSSLAAPLAIWMAWGFFGWGDGESIPELVVRFAAPIFAAPFVLRFVSGTSPAK